MTTVSEIAARTSLKPRTIQKRIVRLGLQVRRVGPVIHLTDSQAERIEAMDDKPGPKKK